MQQLLASLSKLAKAPVHKPAKAPVRKPAKAPVRIKYIDMTADMMKKLIGVLQATQANNNPKNETQEWDPDSDPTSLHGKYVFIVFGLGSNTLYFSVFIGGSHCIYHVGI